MSLIHVRPQCVVTYFLIGFKANFGIFYVTIYTLAMASTALAVMLGCAVEDPKLAQEFLPVLFVPQMLFSGLFVVPTLIPVWLRWAQYLCSLTYAVRLVVIAEFWDCGGTDDPSATYACNGLVKSLGANPDNDWWYWLVLVAIFSVFRLAGLLILRKKATKFY